MVALYGARAPLHRFDPLAHQAVQGEDIIGFCHLVKVQRNLMLFNCFYLLAIIVR